MSDLSDRVRQVQAFDGSNARQEFWNAKPPAGTEAYCFENGASWERARTQALDAALCDAVEALEYYAQHESVIKEAYHSNDERQITCVHTFINHTAREALTRIERALSAEAPVSERCPVCGEKYECPYGPAMPTSCKFRGAEPKSAEPSDKEMRCEQCRKVIPEYAEHADDRCECPSKPAAGERPAREGTVYWRVTGKERQFLVIPETTEYEGECREIFENQIVQQGTAEIHVREVKNDT